MKKVILIAVCILNSILGIGQGNSWIQYGGASRYYTIKIPATGIYHLDHAVLVAAGIDPSTIDPRNFQIFGWEKEVPIYISGAQDLSFDPGDYIEFYAEANDGRNDTSLYIGGEESMPDLHFSLYNDTICYFLTWNNSVNNLRIQDLMDTVISTHTPLDWVWTESHLKSNVRYLLGYQESGASSSYYTAGEGWFGDYIDGYYSQAQTDAVPTPFPYQGPGAPDAKSSISFASASNSLIYTGAGNHHTKVQIGSSFQDVMDTVFMGYKLIRYDFLYANSLLENGSSKIRYQTVNDLGALSDYQNVGNSSITYPRIPNLNGASTFRFTTPYNISDFISRIDFTNYAAGNLWMYILGDSVYRMPAIMNGASRSFLVPNEINGNDRECVVISDNAFMNVSVISPVNGTGIFTDYASLNVQNAYLIITHPKLWNAAQQYASYRSSVSGGAYNTLVVDVNELYLQYGHGVEKHIDGIRNFLKDISVDWNTHPGHLLLMGKAIREATESSNGTFHGTRKDTAAFRKNLVPSYGYPSSDVLISAGLFGAQMEPGIATGRIAAQDEQTVLDYLAKVQEFETAQDPNSLYTIEEKEWMKHILHFGGGSTTQEQSDFAYYLSTFESIIEDTLFGAYVHSYYKQSSDPIDPIEFDEVKTRLEEGVSIMNFFGHSSVNGFDQNIDEPSNWTNQGKYPLLIGNACYSGDIFQPDAVSASEDFVFQPQKGVIGFLSSSKQGFISPLYGFTSTFYGNLSRFHYGETIGKLVQYSIQSTQPGQIATFIPYENACTQMTLHGDPALRLNPHNRPELVVRQQDVYFEPNTVTLADDSVNVNVIISNIGRSVSDTVIVELKRHLPSGSELTYIAYLPKSNFRDTVVFRIPVLHNVAVGINFFDVAVDIPSFIPEQQDELSNNQTTATLFIFSNGIFPVFPYEYAIVPDSIMDLKASTYDPLIGVKTYRFEIDTTDQFNSPALHFQMVTAGGGVVIARQTDWLNASGNPDPFIFSDSTVYFWRVSPDSVTYSWHESSFQYIPGLTGWGQAHFYQFEANEEITMHYDRAQHGWYWDPNIRRIGCDVYTYASNSNEFFGTLWTIDGSLQDYSGCGVDPAIHVAVIDPLTLEPWGTYGCDPSIGGSCPGCTMINSNHSFGNINDGCACRNRVEYYFNFRHTSPAEMDSLVSMVNNKIPAGHYLLLYTWRFADYNAWTPATYAMINSLGAGDSIYPGRPNESWIVLAKKGDPSFTKVFMGGSTPGTLLSMNDTLFGFDFAGSMKSVLAGPATHWGSLYWQRRSLESPSTDSARIYVYGVDVNGAETLLLDTNFTTVDSIVNLSSIVDAQQYPYIRLKGWYSDTAFFTPAQTTRWQLVYTPVPDAAVNGNRGFYISRTDTLQEGESLELAIAVENITPWPMDSLLVHYWVEDQNRVRHYQTYARQDSLRDFALLYDTISINTQGFGGYNSLWMEVNPIPLIPGATAYDQLEESHINNFAQVPFYVQPDITNPILDVTFDGTHILNGDIISAKPQILITLNDENQYLIMNEESDTAFFAVYLTDPAGQQQRVYFNNGVIPVMNWYPSSGPSGKFKIEYQPTLLTDGVYTLLIQATDKSGNASGDVDYRISFEVVNKQTITEVMNYPNPFSTKTHFVFTLTGSEIPDQMKIQILTVSGKIVREIMMEELGPIRIGKNITEYYWDGRDEYGDQLANGVYLYRVITKSNGEDVEKRSTGADPYFKHGFGKMYLMR